jgi:hypothetical protein
MVHGTYLSVIAALALVIAFQALRARQIRRAFFAACAQKDIEIAARTEAELDNARLVHELSAAKRQELEHLATIEKQRKRLADNAGFIALAKEWAGDIRRSLNLGSLPASVEQSNQRIEQVRQTRRLRGGLHVV